ncbi:hypothetical protein OA855_03380 [Pelagibacteraceae bacterium]|nr:hypothetical protein [Pelagibacteraceae bacterium]
MDNYKDWIGKKISRSDIITPRLVDHLKKTIDQNCLSDQSVPEGIFLCLSPDITSLDMLDKDGNTKLGIFLPVLPYKIRMWAGGKITIFDKFEIGTEIKKNSTISSIEFKEGRSGNLCFVNINHEYLNKDKLIVFEKQTAVYREKINKKSITPKIKDELKLIDKVEMYGSSTLLFRYSALTFNGHKIHYDNDYTRNHEGHIGLLVHAPLQATYLLNLARKNNIEFNSFDYRATAPLIYNNNFYVEIGKDPENEFIGRILNAKQEITMIAKFKK